MKLRRGLGRGKVVPVEKLVEFLTPFDGDGDGSLRQPELVKFFKKFRVGGPWFCEVLGKTVWRLSEDRWGQEIDTITIDALAKVINYSMSQPPRPEHRYIIEPEVMQGLKPRKPAPSTRRHAPTPTLQEDEGSQGESAAEPAAAAPRPRSRARGRPRAGGRSRPRRAGAKPRK